MNPPDAKPKSLLTEAEAEVIANRLLAARETYQAQESRAATEPESLMESLIDSIRLMDAAGLSQESLPPEILSALLTAVNRASRNGRSQLVSALRWLKNTTG